MYRIKDETGLFYFYNIKTKETSLIGAIDDLILFLAEGYDVINVPYICCYESGNKYFLHLSMGYYSFLFKKEYEFYDGYGRSLEITSEIIAKARNKFFNINGFYPEWLKYKRRNKYKIYEGEFRKDPVPGTGKIENRYPIIKGTAKKYKHLISDWLNPEMKDFRRGNKPDLWSIGYSKRKPQRSWKEQSKRRYQWKDNKGIKYEI